MLISARSALMASVATLTASAVVIAPSVQPPPPPRPAIQLAAAVQPLAQPLAQPQFNPVAFLIGLPPSLGAPFPTPPPPIVVPTPGSIGSSIINIYNAVEPWVNYGFEVGAWAFGWVPWIGWLAPQIWPIGYNLGESIVQSIVFNIANWLDGNISFGQGLINVGGDTIDAFIQFGIDQWHFWLPSIPIPPLPGIFTTSAQAATLMGPTATTEVGNAGALAGLLDRVTNPLNAGGGVDGAFGGVGSLGSLLRNGIADIGDLLGVPLSPQVSAQSGELEKTSEISTVPPMVKTPFAPLKSLPLAEVAKAVGNVHNEIRTNFNATNRLTDGAGTNGVVQAQGELRGGGAKVTNDIANALRAGKPGKTAADGATASTTVSGGFGDTAKKVVNNVRQAAKDARQAAAGEK